METVKELRLANGLELTIYDASRRIAGDRWYVALIARIPIPLSAEDFEGYGEPAHALFHEFVEREGGRKEILFELKKERNFIDERERDSVFAKLLSELEAHCIAYLGHKRFGDGVKRSRIKEFMDRRTWWRE